MSKKTLRQLLKEGKPSDPLPQEAIAEEPVKVKVKLSTPLKGNEPIVIAKIEEPHDPEFAEFVRVVTVEEQVRLAWEKYEPYEKAAAKARISENMSYRMNGVEEGDRTYSGGKTGRSIKFIAQKVGMKPTTYRYACIVIRLADELTQAGLTKEATELLNVLNHKSVHAAHNSCPKYREALEEEVERKRRLEDERILRALKRR